MHTEATFETFLQEINMRYEYPTAVFDLIVDGEVKATVTAESRGDAGRMLTDKAPEYKGVRYQDRAKVVVREHKHEPAAGNIGKCVFCQANINQGD